MKTASQIYVINDCVSGHVSTNYFKVLIQYSELKISQTLLLETETLMFKNKVQVSRVGSVSCSIDHFTQELTAETTRSKHRFALI